VVGCVRLFFRSLALRADGSASASVTGWGEVCSEPELRGRGIVGLVLREALARMRGGGGGGGAAAPPCALALLHAAAGVASMYEKFGFAACLPIPYGQLAVGRSLPPAPAPAPAALPASPALGT
jgi:predicted GNAT family N-acyltransferase